MSHPPSPLTTYTILIICLLSKSSDFLVNPTNSTNHHELPATPRPRASILHDAPMGMCRLRSRHLQHLARLADKRCSQDPSANTHGVEFGDMGSVWVLQEGVLFVVRVVNVPSF